MSGALHKLAVFNRRENCYTIGAWVVSEDCISSEHFEMKNRRHCLEVLAALDRAGYVSNGAVSFCFRPEPFTMEAIFSMAARTEDELSGLERKLGLNGEPRVLIGEDERMLEAHLETLQYENAEECLFLLNNMTRPHGGAMLRTAAC